MIEKLQKKVEKISRRRNWTKGGQKCRVRVDKWKDFCIDNFIGHTEYENRKILYKSVKLSLKIEQKQPLIEDFSTFNSLSWTEDDDTLQKSGQETLNRFLTIFKQTIFYNDDICMEIFTSLSSTLLHLMHEDDAFACMTSLLSSNDHFTLFKKSSPSPVGQCKEQNPLYSLDYNQFPNLEKFRYYLHCVNWPRWVLCDLPDSHLVYSFDCLLSEGVNVISKIAFTLLNLWYNNKGFKFNSKCVEKFNDDVSDFCRNIIISPQDLLKMTFNSKQRKTSTGSATAPEKSDRSLCRRVSSISKILTSNINDDQFPDFLQSSSILTFDQMISIFQKVPLRHHLQEIRKIFSMQDHGISFIKFWSMVDEYAPTILIIGTTKKEVFGAFCAQSWSTRRHTAKMRYFGTGESFLFKCTSINHSSSSSSINTVKNGAGNCTNNNETVFFYPWVGKELCITELKPGQELFQAANDHCLLIGGGAISLRNNLGSGSSDAASTFLNPPLSTDKDFDVEVLEVYGFC